MVNRVLARLLLPLKPVGRLAVRLKRKYRLIMFTKGDHKVIEVCGGRKPVSEASLNVDAPDAPEVDIVHILPEPLPFAEATIDRIISIATLEHFTINDMRLILKDFSRVLKPGGEVILSMPSLDKIFAQYKKVGVTDEVLRYLYGGQKDEYDVHLSCCDFDRFSRELSRCSFDDIEEVEYDYELHSPKYMMKIVAVKPKRS